MAYNYNNICDIAIHDKQDHKIINLIHLDLYFVHWPVAFQILGNRGYSKERPYNHIQANTCQLYERNHKL